ncbi:MAG: transglycosylase SLT domain-containing protein [Candidatus Cryptobacteroides sp.]
MRRKYVRIILKITFIVLLLLLVPLCERGRYLERSEAAVPFGGQTVRCVLDTGDDMYSRQGLKTGFSYEMLRLFAAQEGIPVTIVEAMPGENYEDSLMVESIDILVRCVSDTLDSPDIRKTLKTDHFCVWNLRADKTAEIKAINLWLSGFIKKKEYKELRNRFYSSYDPFRRLAQGTLSRRLSPYDDLIKKYAATIGWDWRMLCAVIYQESRFSISTVSSRGARGLMQIIPSTAAYYGVTDLLDPEENIKAGTRHLGRLQKAFSDEEFTQEERIKFTLAAYNAGEGRIADCRAFATANEVDSTKWDDIVSVIPDMRRYTVTYGDTVRQSGFRGTETINYVNRVTELYEAFCEICPD